MIAKIARCFDMCERTLLNAPMDNVIGMRSYKYDTPTSKYGSWAKLDVPKNRRQLRKTLWHKYEVRMNYKYTGVLSLAPSMYAWRLIKLGGAFIRKHKDAYRGKTALMYSGVYLAEGYVPDMGVSGTYERGYQLYNIVWYDGKKFGFGHPEGRDVEIAWLTYNKYLDEISKPQGPGFSTPEHLGHTPIELFITGNLEFQERKKVDYALTIPNSSWGTEIYTKYGIAQIRGINATIPRRLLEHCDIIYTGSQIRVRYSKGQTECVDDTQAVVRLTEYWGGIRYAVADIMNNTQDIVDVIEEYAVADRWSRTNGIVVEVQRGEQHWKAKIDGDERKVNGRKYQKAIAAQVARAVLRGPDFMDEIASYIKLPLQYRVLASKGIRIGNVRLPVEIKDNQIYLIFGERRIKLKKGDLQHYVYHNTPLGAGFLKSAGITLFEFLETCMKYKYGEDTPENRAKKTLMKFVKRMPWIKVEGRNLIVTSVSGRIWEINMDSGAVEHNGRYVCIVDTDRDIPIADRVLARVMAVRNDRYVADDVFTIRNIVGRLE